MQFIDLNAQQARIRDAIERNIERVLDHNQYILGPENEELEKVLAEYVGVKHAIGCASGTDALLLAMMAYGVGPGDAVFTSPFTFIATAETISLLGATPVFVDIDARSFNMDPALLDDAISSVKQGRVPNSEPTEHSHAPLVPKCVIGVDLFGLPAEYDQINRIANENDLFVIEDAAQSFGAAVDGKRSCSLAAVGCTSFFPAKPLGCYGDGGMCFTDRDDLTEAMISIRVHGQGTHRYDNVRIGINGRLDTLQAAILLAKFEIFPEELLLRKRVAEKYTQLIEPIQDVETPIIPSHVSSSWAIYSILASDEKHRSYLQGKLKEAGVPTAVYYPKPLHIQPAFSYLGYGENDFPVSENCAKRIFSLPMHPYLSDESQEQISGILRS